MLNQVEPVVTLILKVKIKSNFATLFFVLFLNYNYHGVDNLEPILQIES